MPRPVLSILAVAVLGVPAVTQDPVLVAREVLADGFQTDLPADAGPDPDTAEIAVGSDRRRPVRPEPALGPTGAAGLGTVLWILGAVVAAVAIAAAVRASVRRGRDVRVTDAAGAADAAVPAPRAFDPGSLPLDEAERLAREGRYGDAVRILLQRTFDALRAAGRSRGFALAPWMTSREILRRAPLEPAARRSLGSLVDAVERSLFAHSPPGADEYAACAAAFRALAGGGTAGEGSA